MAELEVPKSMPSVPTGEDIINGVVKRKGASPGRMTRALRRHVFKNRAFCHQVRVRHFTCKTESQLKSRHTDQTIIIGKNIKNITPGSRGREFKQCWQ
jgi:hypothetical protein